MPSTEILTMHPFTYFFNNPFFHPSLEPFNYSVCSSAMHHSNPQVSEMLFIFLDRQSTFWYMKHGISEPRGLIHVNYFNYDWGIWGTIFGSEVLAKRRFFWVYESHCLFLSSKKTHILFVRSDQQYHKCNITLLVLYYRIFMIFSV